MLVRDGSKGFTNDVMHCRYQNIQNLIKGGDLKNSGRHTLTAPKKTINYTTMNKKNSVTRNEFQNIFPTPCQPFLP